MFSCENIFLGKLFWYQVHFDMHVRTHTREHLYYCSQCHYSSITKNCLKRHVIQKHSNILLKCPTDGCDYSTPDKYKLQAHLKVHTELVSSKPKRQPPPPPGCPVLSHIYAYRGITAQVCEHPAPSRHRGVLLLPPPPHASQSFHPPSSSIHSESLIRLNKLHLLQIF